MEVRLIRVNSTPDTPTDTQHTWRKPKPAPSRCNLCNVKLGAYYVAGMTRLGLFKTMCVTCHSIYGIGLGTQHGTLFEITNDGAATVWGA